MLYDDNDNGRLVNHMHIRNLLVYKVVELVERFTVPFKNSPFYLPKLVNCKFFVTTIILCQLDKLTKIYLDTGNYLIKLNQKHGVVYPFCGVSYLIHHEIKER